MSDNRNRDPYLYDDIDILKNIPGVKTAEELKRIEGDLTKVTMGIVYAQDYAKFNTGTLCQIHRTIFGSLFDWAGEFRTIHLYKREELLGGDTVRYAQPQDIKKELAAASKEISKLKLNEDPKTLVFKIVRITASIWHTHPFREGNTRTVVAFSVLLAAKFGIQMDYALFEKHASYVRNALVWCTQGIYSKFEYLEQIYYDAAGLINVEIPSAETKNNKYSSIGKYQVSDYKEQPHIYIDISEDRT